MNTHPLIVGLTLIELVVVISVLAILMGITAPVLVRAANRGRLAAGTDRIIAVHREARALALRFQCSDQAEVSILGAAQPGVENAYGIALVQQSDQAAYATLIFGSTSAASELTTTDGASGAPVPVFRRTLPASVVVTIDGAPLNGRLVWFYAWRSGVTVQTPDSLQPIDLGVAACAERSPLTMTTSEKWTEYITPWIPACTGSPVCTSIEVRNRGGRMSSAVAIYESGNALVAVRE
jgi:prepilin-type N-terminal cleavage/methylation domain-containing protein